MDFDYNEYDSLSLLIKKKESGTVLSYYNSFGWEECERRDDKRYSDILHIRLKRRHKIPNKDRLQLLQIEMENALNRFALLRKKKHSRSITLGFCFAFTALSLILLGVSLIIFNVFIPLAVSVIALGALPFVFAFPTIKRIINAENKLYAIKFKEMAASISRTICQAERLLKKNDKI